MTHTHQYELMVILDTDIDERLVPATLDRLLKVITTDGGTIDSTDVWGRRRFAYEIQKKTEGVYAVVNFTSSSATAQELDRQLKLNEQVLRTKVLRAEDAIAMVAAEKERSDARAARRPAGAPDAPARSAAPARAPRAPRPDRDRSDRPARSSSKG